MRYNGKRERVTVSVDSMQDIIRIKRTRSRSISAENPTGEKGRGAADEAGVCSRFAVGFPDGGKGWKLSPSVVIAPGETRTLADIQGPAVIKTMWFTGCLSRDFILRAYWDNQPYPSVEVPITDFFVSGWQSAGNKIGMEFALIDSAAIAVCPNNGFNCFFPMPFKRRCVITIESRSERASSLYYQINYELGYAPDDCVYFHARWNRTNPVPSFEPHVILDGVKGRGHYVGTALHVGINGPNLWFGEGEVKFYIDGDREYPTICTTGTEDYFGGAWGWDVNGYTSYSTRYLGVPFIHEPRGGEDCQQRFAMYRWHLLDPVIFEEDLKVTIQDLGWRKNGERYLSRNDDFSSVAYWYQTLPGARFPPLPDRDFMEVI